MKAHFFFLFKAHV